MTSSSCTGSLQVSHSMQSWLHRWCTTGTVQQLLGTDRKLAARSKACYRKGLLEWQQRRISRSWALLSRRRLLDLPAAVAGEEADGLEAIVAITNRIMLLTLCIFASTCAPNSLGRRRLHLKIYVDRDRSIAQAIVPSLLPSRLVYGLFAWREPRSQPCAPCYLADFTPNGYPHLSVFVFPDQAQSHVKQDTRRGVFIDWWIYRICNSALPRLYHVGQPQSPTNNLGVREILERLVRLSRRSWFSPRSAFRVLACLAFLHQTCRDYLSLNLDSARPTTPVKLPSAPLEQRRCDDLLIHAQELDTSL